MEGILLPICSVFFSTMLCITYFAKKRIDLIENKVFSAMLIFSVIDSIIVSVLQVLASNHLLNNMILNVFNKVDYITLIIYTLCILIYTILITIPKDKYNKNILFTALITIDVIASLLIIPGKVELISNGNVFSVSGTPTYIVYAICGINLLLSFFIVIINHRRTDKRHIPIYSLLIIGLLLMLMFNWNPYLIVISITLTFLDYLMYFTIENPDMKMINELNVAIDKAEQANAAKTDFLSSMSHEIRTPLNAIVGFSESIKDAKDLEEAQENATDIITASQTLLDIVNGILNISKIEANKMEIVNGEYDFKQECNDIVTLVTPRIGEKPIELKKYIAPDIPDTLYGDKGKVKEIITNLLTNAVKYTEKGYIELKVSCINKNDICTMVISIEDSGRGIKPESIDKLFSKFERLDEDRNTTTEGTGLGLAITKKLVEMLGGKIIVQSVYGSGSKFTIYLQQKIVNKPVTTTQQFIKDEPLILTGKKVLVVDDNFLNIKVAEKVLKKYDLIIDSCESGPECIDKIKQGNKYDLILLDDMMPKVTGTETLNILRGLPDFNIKTVVLTANAIEGTKEKYIDAGFDDYLSKPMEKADLERVLKRFINKQPSANTFEPLPDSMYKIDDNAIEKVNQ